MLLTIDATAREIALSPRHRLDIAETGLLEDKAQVLLVETAVVLAVLDEYVIQSLNLGPEAGLWSLAAATDGVQNIPAWSQVGLDVFAHIGNDDPQDASFFQATTAFRKQARTVAGRFEVFEIVFNVYCATRPVAQRQIATAIGSQAHAWGRE